MKCRTILVLTMSLAASFSDPAAFAAEWWQFRGPGGRGLGGAADVPVQWSESENVRWKTPLPGPGGSSPVTVGNRTYLTCYTGYGLKASEGDMQKLRRHLLCINRRNGEVLWTKDFDPALPEHQYAGEGAYHGYASSTPVTDGKVLYIFFGKSGLYCCDLDGNERWHARVGDRVHGWGSATSPLLYGDLVIVNASVESGSLVAFNRNSGEEVWRTGGINSAWNTPLLFAHAGRDELVVSIQARLRSFDPASGKELWNADGIHRYVCPSVVEHKGTIYAIGGGHTSVAVRAGGSGDVTESSTVWRAKSGSNVSSPVYHDGHLYWASDSRGIVYCQNAETGEFVYEQRLKPASGLIYGSPVLVNGRIYYPSQRNGTFVVPARPEFELLAHNVLGEEGTRCNSSPVVSGDDLLLRTDAAFYCLGKNSE